MRIDTININENSTGVQTVDVPQGAAMQSAILLSGVVQINFSHAGGQAGMEPASFRIVSNGDDYTPDFEYLAALVDYNSKRVTHLLYRRGAGGAQVNPL